jgi:hypothetical protein
MKDGIEEILPELGVGLEDLGLEQNNDIDSGFKEFLGEVEFEEQTDEPEFQENLAEYIDETALTKISSSLLQDIEDDKKTMSRWVRSLEDVAQEVGIYGYTDTNDEKFPGELSITFPIIAKAQLQFYSRAVDQIFPSEPVAAKVFRL